MQNKIIKISSYSDRYLWYAQMLGKVFSVVREDHERFWVREPDYPYCLNWVNKKDAEVLNGNFSN